MGDQRVEARPALGLEDPGDGQRIAGVGGQAIDGLGRKGDELSRLKREGGRLYRFAVSAMVTVTGSGMTSVFFHSFCPTPKARRLTVTRAVIFA